MWQASAFWILDFGFWIFEFGGVWQASAFWILDFGFWIFGEECVAELWQN